jgi:hypothetical protein
MREVKYMRILVVVLLVALGVFAGYTVGRDHIISPPVTVSPPAIAVCPNTFERVSISLNTLRIDGGAQLVEVELPTPPDCVIKLSVNGEATKRCWAREDPRPNTFSLYCEPLH